MPYASVAEFRQWYGETRLPQLFPGGATDEEIDAQLLRSLEAGAALFDSSAQEAEYPVPLDLSEAGDYEPRLTALVKARNLDLALGELTFGLDAKPADAEAAVRRSDLWRQRLVGVKDPLSGRRIPGTNLENLPGLTRSGGVIRKTAAWPIQTEDMGVHSFTTGVAMARTAGAWALAVASDEDLLCAAVCTAVSGPVVEYAILSAGVVNIPAHGLVGDENGWLWLSPDTPGLLIGTRPDGPFLQRPALVKDSNHLILFQGPVLAA